MRRFVRVAWLATTLAACSGSGVDVGEGTEPVELFLGVDSRLSTLAMEECVSVQIGAFLRFDGDAPSVGDFSSRADFRSSDPSTVFVGDGVTPSPDGVVYAPGVLIALRPGLATISATYLDFAATLSVQVESLRELRIEPTLTDIAEDLPQKFDLIASFSQARPDQDISDLAAWYFDTPTGRASVDEGGAVQANSFRDDEQLTLVARVPECGRTVSTAFRVSAIDSLELEYENGDDARLPLGYSEALRVYGHFAYPEATRQNLSGAVEIDELPDDFLSAVTVQSGPPTSLEEVVNPVNIRDNLVLVTALDEAAVVGFDLVLDSGPGWRVATRLWQLLDLNLESVSITPDSLRIRYPDEGKLSAIGLFSNGMQRDISRHVTWTSLDPSSVVISTAADAAGKVNTANVERDVEVEAYAEAAKLKQRDYALVQVYSSDNTELPGAVE